MSALASFKDNLRKAYKNGYVYKITDKYVKIRRWSTRGYFTTMSAWRIRLIGNRVKIKMDRADARAKNTREAREARTTKRSDAYGDAAAAINHVSR